MMLPMIMALTVNTVSSQSKKATASFEKESHDFGKIKEADGPVSFNFVFTNIGAEPFVINNVTASCGCTTPNYTKEPVLPGAKGTITVTYNPAGRPGRFQKTITVKSNGDPETQILTISGEVIPKEPSIEDQYPQNIEGLRLKSHQIAFNKVSPNEKPSQKLEAYNSTDQPMKVEFMGIPPFLKIEINPQVIQPKQTAVITATYDAAARNDWGFLYDRVGLIINGKQIPSRLAITANIEEDFSKLTEEQKKNAPKIVASETEYNFGTIAQGEKVKHDFVIKNEGKSDLLIRKVSATCGCTVVNVANKSLKPGESTSISAEFNSSGRSGSQSKAITIISNDPTNSKLVLWIKGNIEEKK